MNIFVIGRCLPEEKTGLIGLFEFEQAVALKKYGNNRVTYLFADNRSIKTLRKIGKKRCEIQGIQIYGTYLPVGGIPTACFNKIKYKQFQATWKKAIQEQGEPDIVHVHFPLITTNDFLWNMWREYECQVIVTEHWSRVQNKTLRPCWQHMLERTMQEADAVICVSELLRESMLELTGIQRKVYVIPNMVSDKFRYNRIAESKSLKADDRFNFIAVARLVQGKRMNQLIEAFSKAFLGEKKIQLTIVGDGPERKKLQNKIENLGIQKQIHLTGYLASDKVAELMEQSDCFVSASVFETFGVPWVEAWCCGLPVIGMENGPIDDYFTPENSRKFIADNAESLQSAMMNIYKDRSKFNPKEISENAVSKFSAKAVAVQLEAIFNSL